jgi:hypothetical protein
VLCVLGIWSKCVETVVADVAVESYAISEKDFGNLFLSEADLQTFEEMKQREVYNFKMDTSIKCEADAALEFGKPLYICIFSRLDLIVVGASGLAPTGFDRLSDPYAIVEIINLKDGNKLNFFSSFFLFCGLLVCVLLLQHAFFSVLIYVQHHMNYCYTYLHIYIYILYLHNCKNRQVNLQILHLQNCSHQQL